MPHSKIPRTRGKIFKVIDGKIMSAIEDNTRNSMGRCYYCHEVVMASPDQAIKHITIKDARGSMTYPTHKKCRKESRN